ncbi:unnamed protein product [Anisakis simplex]|uniref:SCP domain-containing protein n=1 Tax=Anisakis simplex TaxID=6269 RepID=A0A0M3K3P3_ANISI|nr:unnamed protein product [Anisakis simplex]
MFSTINSCGTDRTGVRLVLEMRLRIAVELMVLAVLGHGGVGYDDMDEKPQYLTHALSECANLPIQVKNDLAIMKLDESKYKHKVQLCRNGLQYWEEMLSRHPLNNKQDLKWKLTKDEWTCDWPRTCRTRLTYGFGYIMDRGAYSHRVEIICYKWEYKFEPNTFATQPPPLAPTTAAVPVVPIDRIHPNYIDIFDGPSKKLTRVIMPPPRAKRNALSLRRGLRSSKRVRNFEADGCTQTPNDKVLKLFAYSHLRH